MRQRQRDEVLERSPRPGRVPRHEIVNALHTVSDVVTVLNLPLAQVRADIRLGLLEVSILTIGGLKLFTGRAVSQYRSRLKAAAKRLATPTPKRKRGRPPKLKVVAPPVENPPPVEPTAIEEPEEEPKAAAS